MIEVVIDRDAGNLQNGATFYFECIGEDFLKLIDICFKHNRNREFIEIRKVDNECRDI